MFGTQWRFPYEEQIYIGSDGTMKYARGDGSTSLVAALLKFSRGQER
jgi:hypothetical protein